MLFELGFLDRNLPRTMGLRPFRGLGRSVVSVAPSCLSMFLRKVAPRRQSSVYNEDPEIVLRLISFDNARKNISMKSDFCHGRQWNTGFFFWFGGDAGADIPNRDITIISAGNQSVSTDGTTEYYPSM